MVFLEKMQYKIMYKPSNSSQAITTLFLYGFNIKLYIPLGMDE